MTPAVSRRNFLRLSATGAAAGALGWVGHAQPPGPVQTPAARPRSGAEFITPDAQTAIDNGLEFLARTQLADGSFPGAQGTGPTGATVGVAALCGLALMAGGHQPGRGKYGKHVARIVDYVTAMAHGPVPGFLTTPGSQELRGLTNNPGPIYSHGFATLFLAEVCGMLPDAARQKRVRAALELAVAFTVSAQNREGGWRYDPRPTYADVSVTTAQMMALRAAKNAGLIVRKNVIDSGVAYIKGCQMPDGGFSYWKGQGGLSAFPRSAAAIVGLYSAGLYDGPEVERGLRYLQRFIPGRQFSPAEVQPQYYWYGQYYAALAMWTAGDDYWALWLPAIRDELLGRGRFGGGAWIDPYYGAAYATAMALIILQLPNNYLPILQK
jgi:hypothetical protein